MRWTPTGLLTRAPEADGEIVWFRRPDAGIKPAVILRITPAMVAKEPGHQGDHV